MTGVPPRVEAQVPAGPEFRINAYTSFAQYLSSVAYQPTGDFIVVWTSRYEDGDQDGVFGQRFKSDGGSLGAEFRVSTYTMSEQRRPHVAVQPNGDFIVVWDHRGYGQRVVYGRRFDRTGAPRGGEFRVNQERASYFGFARAASGPQGRFLVVWTSYRDGSGSAAMARLMDASGAPLTDEFVVNTNTFGTQDLADVSASPDGGFVVVWQDRFGLYPYGSVFGQRLAANGSRVGSDFRIDDTGTMGHWSKFPSVSVGPDGGFIVVWTDFEETYVYDARARLFDAHANPRGGSFVVHTDAYGKQFVLRRQVAHDEAGNFVITWQAYQPGADRWSVFGQRFGAEGARRGSEFRVNSYTTATQTNAVLASDSAGNLVVGWEGYGQSSGAPDVYGQRFGGLLPAALGVADGNNGVLEVADNFELATAWLNVSSAPQTFQGRSSAAVVPPGLSVTLSLDADYGTAANGAAAVCNAKCFTGNLTGARPAGHVDVSFLETIRPDALGQVKRWRLHIGDSFADVPRSSPFYRLVETLLHRGVTSGCGATTYCPTSPTTREQMAPFVLVAKEGVGYTPPACTTPVFADVPASSPFCRWIEELARRGITGGCGGGNYCPGDAVLREQMAVFVLRTLDPALNPPACVAGTELFADVPSSSPFCRWIEELARRGVVTGCGGGNYCPAAPVTREQMAVFLTGTFGLTLYGL